MLTSRILAGSNIPVDESDEDLDLKQFLLGVSALALATSLASAADLPARNLPVRQAPIPIFFTWTGFSVGAHVGGTWGKTSVTETPLCGTPCVSTFDHSASSAIGGVQANANYQMGAIVLGLATDISASGYDNKALFPCCAPDYVQTRIKWEASIRARLGYAFDRLLLYVTGGVAFAEIERKYYTFGPDTLDSFSQVRTGWTIGAGAEYAFTQNWSVFSEYRYSDYGHSTYIPPSFAVPTSERHHDTTHGVRVGVNFRF
jgi:outer membrane immunogenic protein